MTTLGWYVNDASALLHDQAFSFTSVQALIRWINEARRQAAQRTGCIQRVVQGQSAFGASAQPGSAIPGGMQPGALPNAAPNAQFNAPTNTFNTIMNVERYPYRGFVNPLLRAQHAGVNAVIDTVLCSVAWGGGPGGSPRPALAWLPWMDLEAYARSYANLVSSYPYYWSVFNDGENGEIWLFPVPSQPLQLELTVTCIPSDLKDDNDYDAIPEGFANAIKYGAASMAYLTSRRYGQAQIMADIFNDRLGIARTAVDSGKVPNFYFQGV
jgi:hypothetical protein